MALPSTHDLYLTIAKDGTDCFVTLRNGQSESPLAEKRVLATPPDGEGVSAEEFGKALAAQFLPHPLKAHLQNAWRKAIQAGSALYLWLSIEEVALSELPWERLYFEGREEEEFCGFLCLQPAFHLIRRVGEWRPPGPPLNSWQGLAAYANPKSLDFPHLRSLKYECGKVAALMPDCEKLSRATPDSFWKAVQDVKPQWIHFAGHGTKDRLILESVGVQAERANPACPISASEMLGWFPAEGRSIGQLPRLIFLSACHAGRGTESFAAELARAGVPAVIALQDRWKEESAANFAQAFYPYWEAGDSVEEAVARARDALRAQGTEWAIPVLYLTAPDSPRLPEEVASAVYLAPRPPIYVGRDALLDEIEQALAEQGSQVALEGVPGSGEYTTALAYAYRAVDRKTYRFAFEINAPNAQEQVIELCRLGERVGIRSSEVSQGLARNVCDRLQQEDALLIARNVTERTDLNLLPGFPCRLILTMTPEVRFPNEAQDRWKKIAMPPLDEAAALKMLNHYFPIQGETELAAAKRIVEFFVRLPYWLKVIGTNVEEDFGSYADYLNDVEAMDNAPPEIASFLNALYTQLNAQEAFVLQNMTCFAGRKISRALLQDACGLSESEMRRPLRRLEKRSLCTRHSEGRFDVHEVVRRFVQAQMTPARRIEALTQTAKALQGYLQAAIDQADWAKFHAEYAHLRAVAERGAELRQGEAAAPLYLQEGIYWYECGDYKRALDLLEKGRFWEELHHREETMNSARFLCYRALAEADQDQETHTPRARMEKALEIVERLLAPDDLERVTFYNHYGYVLKRLGDPTSALTWYERALALILTRYPHERLLHIRCLNYIGAAYMALDDDQRALTYYEEALALAERHLPPRHDLVAILFNVSGQALRKLGQWRKALERHEQALDICQELFGEQSENVADTLVHLARAHEAGAEFGLAAERYRAALLLYAVVCGAESKIYARIQTALKALPEN